MRCQTPQKTALSVQQFAGGSWSQPVRAGTAVRRVQRAAARAIISPSRAEKPIVVGTALALRVAHRLAPLPRCAISTRPCARALRCCKTRQCTGRTAHENRSGARPVQPALAATQTPFPRRQRGVKGRVKAGNLRCSSGKRLLNARMPARLCGWCSWRHRLQRRQVRQHAWVTTTLAW